MWCWALLQTGHLGRLRAGYVAGSLAELLGPAAGRFYGWYWDQLRTGSGAGSLSGPRTDSVSDSEAGSGVASGPRFWSKLGTELRCSSGEGAQSSQRSPRRARAGTAALDSALCDAAALEFRGLLSILRRGSALGHGSSAVHGPNYRLQVQATGTLEFPEA